MSVYSELMNERLKPEQVYKPPKQTPQQRAENLVAIQKYIADAKAKKAAAEAKPKKTDEAHPEVGGRASPAAMRTSFEDNPHMRPTSAQKSFMRTPGERIKTSAKVIARKVKGGIKKAAGAVKKAVGLGDWTKYEGTPLAEQAQYLQQFLEQDYLAEISTAYIRKARDADYERAVKKGARGSERRDAEPTARSEYRRGIATGIQSSEQARTHTRAKKLVAINRRRKAEK